MFNTLPNYPEVNHLVDVFSPIFNFSHFNEENKKTYRNDIGSTYYRAKATDNWGLIVSFHNRYISENDNKHFYPSVVFQKGSAVYTKNDNAADEKTKITENIVELLQKTYKPNFKNLMNVINIFIEQGLHTGLFNKVDVKKYIKHISYHFGTAGYTHRLGFVYRNYANISFNKVLQKGSGRNGTHFKKSYLNIDITYLVQSDKTMQPYFKIRLPYTANKKSTCLIPLGDSSIMYMAESDNQLRSGYVDMLPAHSLDETSLKQLFEKQFQNEVNNVISSTLKIKKIELEGLTTAELKEYFILVEMIKI